MLAYAFLGRGAVEPLSGFVWPEHGGWVEADAAPTDALRGYQAADLPYWLDDELWTIELSGTLAERDHVLLAERARLVRRIDAWGDDLAWEFVTACARRVAARAAAALREDGHSEAAAPLDEAADLGELEQAALAAADDTRPAGKLAGYTADVCYYARDAALAARGACVAAKMTAYALAADARDPGTRLAAERAWQAAWLVERLAL